MAQELPSKQTDDEDDLKDNHDCHLSAPDDSDVSRIKVEVDMATREQSKTEKLNGIYF